MNYLITGAAKRMPPNKRYARISVQTTLKAWAITKAAAGRPPSIPASSPKFVSSPILTNANANQYVRSPLNIPFVVLTMDSGRMNEKRIKEALMEPPVERYVSEKRKAG